MPHHDAHSPLVEVEVNDTVGHGPWDASIGDLPHLEENFVFVYVILFVFAFVFVFVFLCVCVFVFEFVFVIVFVFVFDIKIEGYLSSFLLSGKLT